MILKPELRFNISFSPRRIHSSDENHDNQNVNSDWHCQTQRAYVNYVFSSQDETDPTHHSYTTEENYEMQRCSLVSYFCNKLKNSLTALLEE